MPGGGTNVHGGDANGRSNQARRHLLYLLSIWMWVVMMLAMGSNWSQYRGLGFGAARFGLFCGKSRLPNTHPLPSLKGRRCGSAQRPSEREWWWTSSPHGIIFDRPGDESGRIFASSLIDPRQ
jgi:hypothetical protein